MNAAQVLSANSTHEDNLGLAFFGVCTMLVSILILLYYHKKNDCAGYRVLGLLLLLFGEALLFPWHSPTDWLKVAMIATVNYVLGSVREMLDGVAESVKRFALGVFRSGSVEFYNKSDQVGLEKDIDASKFEEQSGTARNNLPIIAILRRMLWPDQPLK